MAGVMGVTLVGSETGLSRGRSCGNTSFVFAGLDPASSETAAAEGVVWMAGSSPAKTIEEPYVIPIGNPRL
jgi:hypothetical protein